MLNIVKFKNDTIFNASSMIRFAFYGEIMHSMSLFDYDLCCIATNSCIRYDVSRVPELSTSTVQGQCKSTFAIKVSIHEIVRSYVLHESKESREEARRNDDTLPKKRRQCQ